MFNLDFAIVGASRSGTTSLHALLSQNPAIYMPPEKELQFFWRDRLYNKGLPYYEKKFQEATDNQVKGEASPPYFHKNIRMSQDGAYLWSEEDDPAKRLAKAFPNTKIIISLRNPVSRAQSQYWKNKWQKKEDSPSFEDAIHQELNGSRAPENHGLCWLYRNRYGLHIEHWLNQFPSSQILILIFEEWIKDPVSTAHQIEDFLGVERYDHTEIPDNKKNAGRVARGSFLSGIANLQTRIPGLRPIGRALSTKSGYPNISTETRELLQKHFEPDIQKLEKLIGRKIEVWRHE